MWLHSIEGLINFFNVFDVTPHSGELTVQPQIKNVLDIIETLWSRLKQIYY
jgi:hypothetical protein